MNIKQTAVYKMLKSVFQWTDRKVKFLRRKPFIKDVASTLGSVTSQDCNYVNINEISIISSNCFAGRIMQDINMEYNSPTLGLYFMYPDYIEFLSDLKYYLTKAKIEFVNKSKYTLGNIRHASWSHWYPIGLLDGKIEIHFLHYHSEEEAAEKWYRRANRVNFNNLFIIGMDQNLCSEQDIRDFDQLPIKNKIFFSTHNLDLKSNEYMPEFRNKDGVGDPYRYGHVFYRHLILHFKNCDCNNKSH